jgi:L-asparaginase
MQNRGECIVILGTGGTIAGTASSVGDHTGYRSGQLDVASLLACVPTLAGQRLEAEQVAQLDSKDMDFVTWQRLAGRCAAHLARPEVGGVVVTHGTDTLEETAWFLQRVLAPVKPLVLTAAMRPATALSADGPQNLMDAVTVARGEGARGVVTVLSGRVWGAADVRKVHGYRVEAFDGGDAGPLALVEEGSLRVLRPWPEGEALGLGRVALDPAQWPWVEIVVSAAGARGAAVDALVAAGVQGLVVAGTGNATVHDDLAAALRRAVQRGVAVRRASRGLAGRVVGGGEWPDAGALGPFKTRVELLLELLARAA